jgi:hypothetical protein
LYRRRRCLSALIAEGPGSGAAMATIVRHYDGQAKVSLA